MRKSKKNHTYDQNFKGIIQGFHNFQLFSCTKQFAALIWDPDYEKYDKMWMGTKSQYFNKCAAQRWDLVNQELKQYGTCLFCANFNQIKENMNQFQCLK